MLNFCRFISYLFTLKSIVFLCFFGLGSKSIAQSSGKKEIAEIRYEQLFERLNSDQETLYVVNFWATWCKPCVAELPEFMKVNKKHSNNPKFKMYLVSLDLISQKERKLIPFVSENNIDAEVLLLNDNKRMNTWISMINDNWSGAIPATALYKNGKQLYFVEGKMTKEELEIEIAKHE